MNLKIKCVICDKEISHPKIDQLVCGSKECNEKLAEYFKLMSTLKEA